MEKSKILQGIALLKKLSSVDDQVANKLVRDIVLKGLNGTIKGKD